jgi:hypothetical protein
MSNIKKSFIFIVRDVDGNLQAGRQADIDNAIKECEDNDIDLDFTVIGKIAEPGGLAKLPLDFDENLIEWYVQEDRDAKFMKEAVNAITKLIR